MEEQIKNTIGNKLEHLNLWIDSIIYEKEGTLNYLRIVLDSKNIIPLNTVVMATRIINPLLDEKNIIEEAYILDVYAKEKGDSTNE